VALAGGEWSRRRVGIVVCARSRATPSRVVSDSTNQPRARATSWTALSVTVLPEPRVSVLGETVRIRVHSRGAS